MTVVAETIARRPSPELRPYVASYIGYHYSGFAPAIHLGLPTSSVGIVLSLNDDPTQVSLRPANKPASFHALASGLCLAPAFIHHNGTQFGVQLELTPAGARSLLGLPAAELADSVVDLGDLLGSAAELLERIRAATSWKERFATLDEILTRRTERMTPVHNTLAFAWQQTLASKGTLRIADLADMTGWSRRHLANRFAAEYGVTPKDAARIVRFERSKLMLQQPDRPSFADVASICGYYDQPHLAREWRDLAGVAPSAWLAGEELPIFTSHDADADATLVA